MINMIFALNYQQQLRQTRSGLFSSLEDSIAALIESCGGKVEQEHKYLTASFDDQTIAFWLDIVILIEKLDYLLKDASDELHGHVCLFSSEAVNLETYSGMLRELASHGTYTGIWLAKNSSSHLSHYFEFDYNPSFSFITKKNFNVLQIKQAKNMNGEDENRAYPLRNTIIEVLEQQKKHSYIVLSGPKCIGLKDGLYHFCKKQLAHISPLVFRFGSGGRGLSCIVDAFDREIKQLFETDLSSSETIHQLESISSSITRERLRDEYPFIVTEKANQFLSLLIDTYIGIIQKQHIEPLIIIENIEEIDDAALSLVMQKVKDLQSIDGVSICCTANEEKNLGVWRDLNFKVMYFSLQDGKDAETSTGKNLSRNMKELWEIAYMCYHLRPYFPGYAFVSLFIEEGKNPAVIERSFEILNALGVITSPRDPEPVMTDFAGKAEVVLGKARINMIKSMVRKRLFAWVHQEKLLPCFNLLTAFVSLDGDCGDDLLLDALYRDVIDGVYSGLKNAIELGTFNIIAGNQRTPALVYIFQTFSALIHGDEEAIRRTFLSSPPHDISSSRYESYIESNLASYQLSIRSLDEAAKSVKKAMLAAQNVQSRGGARAFRLYALVNVVQGNLADAIEYLQFAADHAERSKDWEESVVISYYASLVHFLFGNISKAERLAEHAETEAFTWGMTSWGAKSRFLKGRILFEQGKYFDAFDIFESITLTNENEDTLNAWKYRAKVFSGGFLPDDVKTEGDGAIFMIEAAYNSRNYDKAADLAHQLLMDLPDDNFLFIEQADWQSGFSQAELLLFPQKDFLHRLVSAYQALALSKQKQGESLAEAVSIMQHIARDEKIPDTDMNDSFYFFAQYQVLQNADASEIDLNTAVSMAFKRLQRRASRIDNIETKRSYLSLNRWNAALCEAAKYHKLI